MTNAEKAIEIAVANARDAWDQRAEYGGASRSFKSYWVNVVDSLEEECLDEEDGVEDAAFNAYLDHFIEERRAERVRTGRLV